MFIEPELSLRRRSERFAEGFLRDHPGWLKCLVRNDDTDCTDTDDRDSDSNDHSDGELRDITAHA